MADNTSKNPKSSGSLIAFSTLGIVFGLLLGLLIGLVAAGVLGGGAPASPAGEKVAQRIVTKLADEDRDDEVSAPIESPPPANVQATAAALRQIQAEGRIVNAHEHIQNMAEAEVLLHTMDRFGIGKTILFGTSWFTITLNESVGFTRYDENNEELLEIVERWPDRFEAWPTFRPEDEGKVEKLKSYHARGATGVKLYTGHGYVKRSDGQYMFHTVALDDPTMLPLYAYCQENFLPICYHVQLSPSAGPGIAEEFIAVLTAFPDLKVICPHFMLSSILSSRLREFLDTFPNLYTDTSFGHDSFTIPGMKRISKDPGKYRELFDDYPGRFVWGTDLVVTDYEGKDEAWISTRIQALLSMVSADTYTSPLVPGATLRGLTLPPDQLRGLLYENFEAIKAKRPEGTKITRSIHWGKPMGGRPTGRKPGERLPPPKKK